MHSNLLIPMLRKKLLFPPVLPPYFKSFFLANTSRNVGMTADIDRSINNTVTITRVISNIVR